MRKSIREIKRYARKRGVNISSVEITGKTHYRLNLECEGRTSMIAVSGTSSDVRTHRKSQILIDKFAGGHNVTKVWKDV